MKSSSLCEDCGMMFETNAELTNHKKKFCLNSKYGAIDQLEKNFQQVSKNRDISKFGKMALSMQGRTYDFQNNQQNTHKLQEEYRNVLKQIEDEKNMKNKLQAQKQKAFRELQALEKQQQQLIIDDKRNNLQDIIARRQMLAREEEQLQREIRQYQNKKKQWQKSQAKAKQKTDEPYEQGLKAGKLNFERAMLEERKHNMELELNAKRREKQRMQNKILQMSNVQQVHTQPKKSKVSEVKPVPIKLSKANPIIENNKPPSQQKKSQKQPSSYIPPGQFNMSRLDRPRTEASFNSQVSKTSSYLAPSALNGTEKILKFNLNKQGKSQQDKLIQSIMAQQYDDLMILSKLPKGSDLYNVKMKQYIQLSKQRMQVQEKAQKQRIQKMKRQFQFEKIMNDKQKQNTQWVDNNRKQFIKKQMEILQNGTEEQGSNTKNSIVLQPSQLKIQSGLRNPSIIQGAPYLGSAQSINSNMKSYPYQMANQTKTSKDPFGYRISILALRNYSLKRAIKIKIIIYQQYYHEKDKGMIYQFTTIYHDQNMSEQDPFNLNFKNKLDATGAIAYNQSFYVPENLQQLYNKNQKQIYLLLIVAEKDQKRMTHQPKPYCWYSFKVTHFGQIKQGRFTVNMYGDNIIYPVPADMNKMKKKKQQEITFEIEEVLMDQHMMQYAKNASSKKDNPTSKQNITNNSSKNQQILQNQSSKTGKASIENNLEGNNTKQLIRPTDSRLSSPNQSKVQMNYPLRMKNLEEQETIKVNQEYFYSNEKPTEFSHIQLKKPLNFDVSVAGLRTLPSYIGPVKLQMSFIDADNSHVLPKEQFLAQIGTDLYNPLVNFTMKIRNQSKIPPSTIIFIRMIAISALDYQVYSLGFSLIYLFLDKEGDTIKKNKINDYLMTSGYYQLPIFWGNIEPQHINIQDLLTNYPPIPCASILIGILENASKISNPMPAYSQKVYNTILFQVDENQSKLFAQQYKREPIDTNTFISGYLQYKGIKKNYSGEEVNKYLFKTLIFSSQNMKNKFQLKWMAEYQQYFGINFVIDKIFIPESEQMYFYFVTLELSPPAYYYKKKKFDLSFCRKINFQLSTVNEIYYTDNEFLINPAYFQNASIILQINRIQIFQSENTQVDNNIEGFAHIVIPLFELEQSIRAVNVMQATLPLLEGDFDMNIIEKLQKNLPATLEQINKTKKTKAEISFRVLNGYFMNQYMPPQPSISSKKRMFKDMAPPNMSFEEAMQQCTHILSNNYNLVIND